MNGIVDHPLRYDLSHELHARPYPTVAAPAAAAFLALKKRADAAARDHEIDRQHLINLLDRHGASHPKSGATTHTADIGRHQIKWESHSEFVTYTAYRKGISNRPFDPSEFEVFPEDWLADAPGERLTSALIHIDRMKAEKEIAEDVLDLFVNESVAVSYVADDNAVIAGDFRIDPAGHLRFMINASEDIGRRRLGRIMTHLCEIESYKSLSMLGLARSRDMSPRVGELDQKLNQLVGDMPGGSVCAEDTLDALLNISAELESIVAQSSYRFGATMAYADIVKQRISVLREARFNGRQTFGEFMMRRYEPAIRTVASTSERLENMSQRTVRAAELLRTRVDVERSAQNQDLLESMDRRADAQLRLQRTVEGLSVVAVSYYAVSLASFLVYPFAEPSGLSKDMLTAMIALPVVGLVWWMIRRIRKSIG
ncbi:MAG: DUF3422 domain-containing protein [Pseudomonadota bacterium]